MNLVILGPQGCGKGTQAELLKEKYELFHVEMGLALREVAKDESELGKMVNEVINVRRELVGNDLVEEVLYNTLQKNSDQRDVILDGAPRRLDQIELIEKALAKNGKQLDKVIYVNIPETDSVLRISKRFSCVDCQSRFILGKDVKNPNDVCPECGGKIEQRPDDTPDGVRKRLAIFREETLPVIEHYRQTGKLIEVDGTKNVEKVFQEIIKNLEKI
jgi:adenylate kinase